MQYSVNLKVEKLALYTITHDKTMNE